MGPDSFQQILEELWIYMNEILKFQGFQDFLGILGRVGTLSLAELKRHISHRFIRRTQNYYFCKLIINNYFCKLWKRTASQNWRCRNHQRGLKKESLIKTWNSRKTFSWKRLSSCNAAQDWEILFEKGSTTPVLIGTSV